MKNIESFSPVFNQPPATQLAVRIISDNLVDTCILYYELQAADGNCVYNANINIAGEDYAGWNGDNNFPYTFVASKVGLTITT